MKRSALVATAIGLIVIATLLIAGRLILTTSYFAQPDASTYVFAIVAVLLAYALAALIVAPRILPNRSSALSIISAFGIAGGLVEILAVAVENSVLIPAPGAILPLGVMFVVFGSWGVAGYLAMRRFGTARLAIAVPISAAMLCMLIAVTAGFVLQLYALFGNAAEVVTWAEYRRSGWSDPVAFQIANTLESACDHLLFGPFLALILGSAGAFVGGVSKGRLRNR